VKRPTALEAWPVKVGKSYLGSIASANMWARHRGLSLNGMLGPVPPTLCLSMLLVYRKKERVLVSVPVNVAKERPRMWVPAFLAGSLVRGVADYDESARVGLRNDLIDDVHAALRPQGSGSHAARDPTIARYSQRHSFVPGTELHAVAAKAGEESTTVFLACGLWATLRVC